MNADSPRVLVLTVHLLHKVKITYKIEHTPGFQYFPEYIRRQA